MLDNHFSFSSDELLDQTNSENGYLEALLSRRKRLLEKADLLASASQLSGLNYLLAQEGFAFEETLEISNDYVPSDQYYYKQWHLEDSDDIDINAEAVWDDYTGAGVKVAIMDDGVEYTHEDLVANYDTSLDIDLYGTSTIDYDAMAENDDDEHGTSVAGLIGADDNSVGGVGVAYDSTISGIRLNYSYITYSDLATGFNHVASNFDVMNNSWSINGLYVDNLNNSSFSSVLNAMENAVTNGRDGLGSSIVFSAGNSKTAGHDVNAHGFQNSRYTIAVGAIADTGAASYYSTPGASVLVSAPSNGGSSGIYTTDRTGSLGYSSTDYTGLFGGTSAAAPIVSGVIALMYEANPLLGYRDVQEILALSARQTDATNSEWSENGASNWNGGGMHVSTLVGYGLVDAYTAVRLAETWTMQHTAANESSVTVAGSAQSIASGDTLTLTLSVGTHLDIDHVELVVDLSGTSYFLNSLTISLTSPDGTTSVLHDDVSTSLTSLSWAFTSMRHFGEDAYGDWTITIENTDTAAITLSDLDLNVYGDSTTADTYVYTEEFSDFATASRTLLSDDDGGIDDINASSISSNSVINLNEGATSIIDGQSLVIEAGTVIENAFAGDGDDQLIGNYSANTLWGGRGDDTLTGGLGDDDLFGGTGTDTAVYSGNYSFYNVTQNLDGTYEVSGLDGTDTLDGVEYLTFANGTFAIDSVPSNSAPTDATSAVAAVEDASVSGQLTATDVDGDALTFNLVSGPASGSLTLASDGSYTFDPSGAFENLAEGETSALSFTYTVTDGVDTIQQVATITVTGSNDAPVVSVSTTVDTLAISDIDSSALSGASVSIGAGFVSADDLAVTIGAGSAITQNYDSATGILTLSGVATVAEYESVLQTLELTSNASGTRTLSIQVDDGESSNNLSGAISVDIDATVVGPTYDITGTTGDDVLRGTSAGESIFGDAGNDMIIAGDGDDEIYGGDDNDRIYGGEGDNYIEGGAGVDYIYGGSGNETLDGGDGGDLLYGYDGDDTLIGGDGNDRAWFSGQSGDYVVTSNSDGSYNVSGADGNDLVIGVERLIFSDGTFYIDDLVTSTPGNSVPTNATSSVGAIEDGSVSGQLTATDLDGDSLTFTLVSGPASGTLNIASDGSYTFDPDGAFETLGEGETTDLSFTYSIFDGIDTVEQVATITVTGSNDAPVVTVSTIVDTFAISDVDGTSLNGATISIGVGFVSGDDDLSVTIGAGSAISQSYDSASGILTLSGVATLAEYETVLQTLALSSTTAGTRTLSVEVDDGSTSDNLSTTVNVDIEADLPGTYDIVGTTGDDVLLGTDAAESIFGDAGNDTILAGAGDDEIYGGDDQDRIYGGAGDNYIDGGAGADYIYGGSGNEILDGGADGDLLYGYSGDDTLIGGDGNDRAWFDGASSDSVVTDNGDGTYSVSGPDGNDVLIGVERLIFSDGTFNIDDLAIAAPVSSNNVPENATSTVAADEDSSVSGQLSATDVDGDTLTFALVSGPASGTISIASDGSYTYDPAGAFESLGEGESTDLSFTYSIFDGTDTVEQVATITVTGTNDAPVVTVSTTIDTLSVSDVDSTNLTSATVAIGIGFVTGDDDLSVTIGGGSTISQSYDNTTGILTLSGLATMTEYETVLQTLVLNSSSNGTRTLSVQVDDGSSVNNLSASLSVDIDATLTSAYDIVGTTGDDVLRGTDSAESIFGDAGNDTIIAGDGDDEVYGGDDNDRLYGGEGNNYIDGGAGVDYIYGGSGNETLDGGEGGDVLYGYEGDDTLIGGDGTDRAWFSGLSGDYVVTSNEDGSYNVDGADGYDLLIDVEKLIFSDGTFAIDGLVSAMAAFGASTSSDTDLQTDTSDSLITYDYSDLDSGSL